MKKKPRQVAGTRHVKAIQTDECSRKTGLWSPGAAKRRRFRSKRRKSSLFLWESEKNNFRFWPREKNAHSSFQKHASITRDPHVEVLPLSDENPLFSQLISRTRFVVPLRARLLFVRAYRVSESIPSPAGAYIVRTRVLWSTDSLPEM